MFCAWKRERVVRTIQQMHGYQRLVLNGRLQLQLTRAFQVFSKPFVALSPVHTHIHRWHRLFRRHLLFIRTHHRLTHSHSHRGGAFGASWEFSILPEDMSKAWLQGSGVKLLVVQLLCWRYFSVPKGIKTQYCPWSVLAAFSSLFSCKSYCAQNNRR